MSITSCEPRIIPLTDQFGRTLRYLRLSVTDRCNLRCGYCNPGKSNPSLCQEPLSWDDLAWMVGLAADVLGVEALRITGGEPTLRPGLAEWIAQLRAKTPSISNIGLTTNGVLLDTMAPSLAAAGVNRVNISIDSLRQDRFRLITGGGDLRRVLVGLSAARESFQRVKVNVVALRNVNLDELADFVAFSDQQRVEVRFIEPMPLGNEKDYWRTVFVSCEELRSSLASQGFELTACESTGHGPASSYRVTGTGALLGFISQMSSTKCADCNKLRLTSDGTLRPCLLSAEEVPLQKIISTRNEEGFLKAMRLAFLDRAERYDLADSIGKSLGRSMQCIGG